MAIRKNADGSITVGILPDEEKKELATPAPTEEPKVEKPKAKRPTKKK